MLLRLIDNGKRRKKRKPTREDILAKASFVALQARLDAIPKFAQTLRPKGLTLRTMPDLKTPVGRTNTHHIASLNSSETVDLGQDQRGTYTPNPVYTGTKMKGVAVLHKSNGVPVFSDEEIVDIARMRR